MATAAPTNFKQYQDRKFMSDDKSAENYTKVPNTVLDCLMAKIKSLSELKVILTVVRLTNGYQKKSDIISISQFQKLSGLTRQGTIDGIFLALKHNYIIREQAGQSWKYTLQLVNRLDYLNNSSDPTSQQIRLELVNEIDQQLVNRLDTQKKGINKTLNKEEDTPNGVGEPTTTTIDLPNFEVTQVYQPEKPLPEALLPTVEAVTPGPTNKGRAVVSLHIPAQPQLDLTQEVKGFGPGSGGGDMHANSKSKPKPKPKDKEPDPNSSHPTVTVFREIFERYPNRLQMSEIVKAVGDLPAATEDWRLCLTYWALHGDWKPTNIDGMIKCFRNGSYKNDFRPAGKGNDRGRGMGGPGSTRPVAAHPAAPDPNHWNRPSEELDRESAAYRP